jgi:hypothetical protein
MIPTANFYLNPKATYLKPKSHTLHVEKIPAPGRTSVIAARYTARPPRPTAPTTRETADPATPRLTAAPARLTSAQVRLTASGGADGRKGPRKSTRGEPGRVLASGETRSSRWSGG